MNKSKKSSKQLDSLTAGSDKDTTGVTTDGVMTDGVTIDGVTIDGVKIDGVTTDGAKTTTSSAGGVNGSKTGLPA